MLSILSKPEYILNPAQIVRRLFQGFGSPKMDVAEVVLPWKKKIQINPKEYVGRAIYRRRVFELEVSETVWRLLDEGAKALDIGANIGYMTSIMAARIGNHSSGSILSFEPHPVIYQTLSHNVSNWQKQSPLTTFKTYPVALSEKAGEVKMNLGDNFEGNHGLATLENTGQKGEGITVQAYPLTKYVNTDTFIDLLKIDVEGHELSVFQGGKPLFEKQCIRDVVFEDHRGFSSPVVRFLASYGYTIFYLSKEFRSVKLCLESSSCKFPEFQPPNFLATTQPERAVERMKSSGWQVL